MQEDISDIQLFNQLFSEYQKRFVYFAFTYLQDEAAAEDVVMDSFIYYWENRKVLETDSNIPAYILKVVKHKCLNYLRSRSIRLKVQNDINNHETRVLQTKIRTLEACEPHELLSEEAYEIVKKALTSLPAQTKDIFVRSRYHNQSYREIAEELGVSVKTVEFHISKALRVLRVFLNDYFPLIFACLYGCL
jgi:RNA polymerase sigma-70 factor (ECF subfamily)